MRAGVTFARVQGSTTERFSARSCPRMDLDIGYLRRAKKENVERLARAIGVSLPRPSLEHTLYEDRLTAAVARELRKQSAFDELDRLMRL